LIGHSLGGAMLYAGAPLVADQIAGLVPIAGVYRFGGRQPLFRLLGRLLAPVDSTLSLMKTPVFMAPVGRVLHAARELLDHEWFGVSPMQAWFPRAFDGAGLERRLLEGFDQTTVGVLRQLMLWAKTGELVSADGTHSYAETWRRQGTMPLYAIAGDRDTLLPPSDAKAGYHEAPTADKHFDVLSRREGGSSWGHLELCVGKRAPAYVWPRILRWLDARATLEAGATR